MIKNLNSDVDQASIFAELIGMIILHKLNDSFDFDWYQHLSTQNIGIALFNNQTKSVADLLCDVDYIPLFVMFVQSTHECKVRRFAAVDHP